MGFLGEDLGFGGYGLGSHYDLDRRCSPLLCSREAGLIVLEPALLLLLTLLLLLDLSGEGEAGLLQLLLWRLLACRARARCSFASDFFSSP